MTDHKAEAIGIIDRLSGREFGWPTLTEAARVDKRAECAALLTLALVEAADAQVAATLLRARVTYLSDLRARGASGGRVASLEDAIHKALNL